MPDKPQYFIVDSTGKADNLPWDLDYHSLLNMIHSRHSNTTYKGSVGKLFKNGVLVDENVFMTAHRYYTRWWEMEKEKVNKLQEEFPEP